MSGHLLPVQRLRPGDHASAGHGDDEARARERGRLVVTGLRELIGPDAQFTAARQRRPLRAATDRATGEGCTVLRAFVDMGWAAALGAGVAPAARRLTVDLTRRHFLPVGGAVGLPAPARGATGHDLVEVRRGRGRHRMLRRPGAEAVPRLTPREVVRPC
ncbi:hypothetical protein [Streptomyces sp. MspMP-M5]|uniref:hypothetical protein n=1 Tax=Streptomyces sp. MspMP-M5 TaxID=1155718 RepID=UPI000369DB40|nr:hypothetical protein [Streptomyces sp. MspMP-M5]